MNDTAAPQGDGDRAAFEAFMSDGGRFPKSVERALSGAYVLMTAQIRWETWQAALAAERAKPTP